MLIARFANHRNPHIALLALSLLETLVQSCGYPLHLQIATKDFLNELVRRFPERPPPFPGPVMSRILELIHGWKEGVCVESRWKEDLGNIRDMHRLLTFKGYRFRELPRRNVVDAPMVRSLHFFAVKQRDGPRLDFCRHSRPLKNWKVKIVKLNLPSYKNTFAGGHHVTLPPHKSS